MLGEDGSARRGRLWPLYLAIGFLKSSVHTELFTTVTPKGDDSKRARYSLLVGKGLFSPKTTIGSGPVSMALIAARDFPGRQKGTAFIGNTQNAKSLVDSSQGIEFQW